MSEFKNLIVRVGTSGGKSFIGEVLALNTICQREKVVIIILPYISLVMQWEKNMKDFAERYSFEIELFYQSNGIYPFSQNVRLAICTIEKSDGLMKKIEKEGKLSEIGMVLFDEFHFIGDPSRGHVIETLATRLLLHAKHLDKEKESPIQLVGLSATISDTSFNRLGLWLDAIMFSPEAKRPVIQYCYLVTDIQKKINPLPNIELCQLKPSLNKNAPPKRTNTKALSDQEFLQQIFLELVKNTKMSSTPPTLVFFFSKALCVQISKYISQLVKQFPLEKEIAVHFTHHKAQKHQIRNSGSSAENNDSQSESYRMFRRRSLLIRRLQHESEDRSDNSSREWIETSPDKPNSRDPQIIEAGVCFHTADLSTNERMLIENAFLDGVLHTIICTSTLSTGVNLPAERVVIMPWKSKFMCPSRQTIIQMKGRAGRTGFSEQAYVYFVANAGTINEMTTQLENTQPEDIQSNMIKSSAIEQLILARVNSGAKAKEDLVEVISTSFAYAGTTEKENYMDILNPYYKSLFDDHKMIVQDKESQKLELSPAGKATLLSGLSTDQVTTFSKMAQKFLVQFNVTHDIYWALLISPSKLLVNGATFQVNSIPEKLINIASQWGVIQTIIEWYFQRQYPNSHLDLVGLQLRASSEKPNWSKDLPFFTTLFHAVLLYEILYPTTATIYWKYFAGQQEIFISEIKRYGFAIVTFMEEYGHPLAHIVMGVRNFLDRFGETFGVDDPKLSLLIQVRGVGRSMAKALQKGKIHGWKELASLSPEELIPICKGIPHFGKQRAKRVIENAKLLIEQKRKELFALSTTFQLK